MLIAIMDYVTKQIALTLEPKFAKLRPIRKTMLPGRTQIVLMRDNQIIAPGPICSALSGLDVKTNFTDIFTHVLDGYVYPQELEYEQFVIIEALSHAIADTLNHTTPSNVIDFLVANRKPKTDARRHNKCLLVFFANENGLYTTLYDIQTVELVNRQDPNKIEQVYALVVPITTAKAHLDDNILVACSQLMCFYVQYELNSFIVVENDLLSLDDFDWR